MCISWPRAQPVRVSKALSHTDCHKSEMIASIDSQERLFAQRLGHGDLATFDERRVALAQRLGRKMNFTYHGNRSTTDLQQSLFASPSRLISRLVAQPFIGLTFVVNVAVVGIGLVAAEPGRAAPLDEGVEQYRAHLIADVDRTLTSAKRLRDSAA